MESEATALLRRELGALRAAASLENLEQAERELAEALLTGSTQEADDAEFNAARLQTSSGVRAQEREGLTRLQALLQRGYKTSDVSFAIVQALYMCGRYREAREQLTSLIRSDPQNERAAAFLELLRETVVSEGRIGLAVMAAGAVVAVAVGVSVLGWLLRRGGKPSSAAVSSSAASSAATSAPAAAAAVAAWVDTIAAAGDVAQEGFSSVAQAWRERYNARIGGAR